MAACVHAVYHSDCVVAAAKTARAARETPPRVACATCGAPTDAAVLIHAIVEREVGLDAARDKFLAKFCGDQ